MRMRRRAKRPSGQFSKLIVALIVLLNVAFAATVLLIFYRTGMEPSTLIVAWFGFTTGELWLLASVKKKKIADGKEENEVD